MLAVQWNGIVQVSGTGKGCAQDAAHCLFVCGFALSMNRRLLIAVRLRLPASGVNRITMARLAGY
jgi:hypothetical protein